MTLMNAAELKFCEAKSQHPKKRGPGKLFIAPKSAREAALKVPENVYDSRIVSPISRRGLVSKERSRDEYVNSCD